MRVPCAVGTFLVALISASVLPCVVFANPQDGTVTKGEATIASAGNTLTVTQTTDKAVIDWRGFDIADKEITNFNQPSSHALTLNRVISTSASTINGAINANGNVMIVNQNGVVFGKNAQVNVNSLVVSTADIDNNAFMAGKFNFNIPGNPNAKIENQGAITAQEAGLVGLVAPNVLNSGVINAKLGRVHLASGDTATVDLYGDGLMEVQASPTLQSQLVENTGTINAEGGSIAMTAAAAAETVHSLIHVGGTLNTNAVGVRNGHVFIYAEGSNAVQNNVAADKGKKSGSSTVLVDGTINAKSAIGTGGNVTVTGDHVALASTAIIDASGATGGGNINVGGEFHGQGPTPTSLTTDIQQGAVINADATQTGNGGNVAVWSDYVTEFHGDITARGGAQSGNGGFVETSGQASLLFDGNVDTTAANGETGTLLLDPTDITISSAASSGTLSLAANTYTDTTSASSNINVTALQTQLASNSITISTTSALGGNGDITFNNAVTWAAAKNLTLTAARDVNFNASVTATNAGTASITVNAGRNITQATGTTLQTGGTGALILNAAGNVVTNIGQVILNGTLKLGTGALTMLSGLDSSSNRADANFTTSNVVLQGATIGAVTINGFRDLTLSRSLSTGAATLTAYRNLNLNNTLTSSGAVTATSLTDLTLGASANITASSLNLYAANNVVTGTGQVIFTNGAVLNVGTGALNITSGLDSATGTTRADQTFASGSIVKTGAIMGAITIKGYRDLTLNNALSSSGAVALTAYRDLTLNNSLASLGTITLSGGRNINLNNTLTSAGTISATATTDLTLGASANITTSAAGGLNLYAANNVVTGTGQVIINNGAVLNVGTGALNITSGLDSATGTTRADQTFASGSIVKTGATIGAITIKGFRDTTISTDLSSSGVVTLTSYRDLTLNNALASTGAITLTASRNINLNNTLTSGGAISATAATDLTLGASANITTGTASGLNLYGANNVVTGTGQVIFTNGAVLNVGTGALNITSGLDSATGTTRADQTFASGSIVKTGATIGAITIKGYRDLTLNNALSSSGAVALTAYRDLTLNSSLTSAAAIALTAPRNINLNGALTATGAGTAGNISLTAGTDLTLGSAANITTGAAGGLNLYGANNVVTGTGQVIFTNGAVMNVGTGALNITSGLDSTTAARTADLTLTSGNLVPLSTLGAVTIKGFRDINLNGNITSSGSMAFTAYRNLTLGAATNLTTGATGGLNLYAAGNVPATGIGQVIFTNGAMLNVGTGALNITSGLNSATGLMDTDQAFTTSNLNPVGASFGSVNINGYRDIDVSRDLATTGALTLTANRNLTIDSGVTLTGGTTMALYAGGATSSTRFNDSGYNSGTIGTGQVFINGALKIGTGISIVSGVDGSGNRVDLTLNSSNFSPTGASFGNVVIDGYRDITVAEDLTTSLASIIAYRDLTIGSIYGNPQVANFEAAGGNSAARGVLTLNGTLTGGTLLAGGNAQGVHLYTGYDAFGNRPDLVIDNTTYNLTSGTLWSFVAQGFHDITVNKPLTANYGITLDAYHNLTINAALTNMTTSGVNIALYAANGDVNGNGIVTLNAPLTTNNAAFGAYYLGIYSGLDDFGNRPDHIFNAGDITLLSPATISIQGFRDITFAANIPNLDQLYATAYRDLIFTSPMAVPTLSVSAGRDILMNAPITTTVSGFLSASRDIIFNNTFTLPNAYVYATRDIIVNSALNITNNNYSFLRAQRNFVINPTGTINITTNVTQSALLISAGDGLMAGTSSGGDFINNRGPDAITATNGNPVYLVIYTGNLQGNGTDLGGLSIATWRYNTDIATNVSSTDNTVYYRAAPTISVTANDMNNQYGNAFTLSQNAYTVAGLVAGNGSSIDDFSTATGGGAPVLSTTATSTSSVAGGPYAINVAGGTLANPYNYQIVYVNGNLVVTPAPITITANNQTQTYGGGNSLTQGAALTSGTLVGSENFTGETLTTNATLNGDGTQFNTNPTPWTITPSNATGTNGFLASNYNITYAPGTLTVLNNGTVVIPDPTPTMITIPSTVEMNSQRPALFISNDLPPDLTQLPNNDTPHFGWMDDIDLEISPALRKQLGYETLSI